MDEEPLSVAKQLTIGILNKINQTTVNIGLCVEKSTIASIYKIRPFLTAAQSHLCRGNNGQLLHQQPYDKSLSRVRALVLHVGPGNALGTLQHPAVWRP